jgi:hypothetical protein
LHDPQRAGDVCRAPVQHHAINHKKTGLDGPVIAVWKGGNWCTGQNETNSIYVIELIPIK